MLSLLLLAPAACDEAPADIQSFSDGVDEEDVSDSEPTDDSEDVESDPRAGGDFEGEVEPQAAAGETSSAWNGIRRISDYYLDPVLSSVSYASVSTNNGGCSAALIGPNMLMTAAHCAADSLPVITAQARVYRDRDLGSPRVENFQCNLLFHTFPETDLAIYHCPSSGMGPGDKFGYLDIDDSTVSEDDILGSVFFNSIDDENVSLASLLTIGEVDDASAGGHWFTPRSPVGSVDANCNNQGADTQRAVEMSLWTEPGASGSAHFDTSSGKIRVGPLSTGVAGSPARNALSMGDYLYYGYIYPPQSTCGRNNTVNASYVSGLGLDPSDYTGRYADQALSGTFDLVSDVEDMAGESRKSWYYLGFDNRRRARLWSTGIYAEVDEAAGQLVFDTHAALNTDQLLATHDDLDLRPNRRYSITFDATSSYPHSWYRVCIDGASDRCSGWWKDDNTTAESRSVVIETPADPQTLAIRGWNAAGQIENVQVVEMPLYSDLGTPAELQELRQTNDFDSFDERQAWFDPANGAPVTILPDGTGSGIDWAGRVSRPFSRFGGARYELATDGFAFPADDDYEVCISHREDPNSPMVSGVGGMLRVRLDDGATVANVSFEPSSVWSSRCMSFSVDPGQARNLRIELGTYGGPGTPSGGAYFVDEVRVIRHPFD